MKLAFINPEKLGSAKASESLGGSVKPTTHADRVRKYRSRIANDKLIHKSQKKVRP